MAILLVKALESALLKYLAREMTIQELQWSVSGSILDSDISDREKLARAFDNALERTIFGELEENWASLVSEKIVSVIQAIEPQATTGSGYP